MKIDKRAWRNGLLLSCLFASRLHAQQAFSWEQIRDKFEKTNPALLSDQVNIDEARAQEITAFLRPNPGFTFSTDGTQIASSQGVWRPFIGTQFSSAIDYLHERQHKRELRLESAQKGTGIVTSTHADLERNLLFQLRNAFVQALQAKAFFDVAKQNLEYWDKEVAINRDRFTAGDLSKVDLSRIILQRAQYQADFVNSQVSLRTAKIALLTLLNDRTPVEKFEVTGSYDFQEKLMRLEEFRQVALSMRPDLKAAMEAVDKAKTDNSLATANGSTDPTFSVWWTHNPSFNNPYDNNALGASVSIPLRIFDRNQGEKLRTKLDIDRADKSRMAAEAQVLSDVDTAYATLNSTVELLLPYKQEYIPQATEVRDIVSFSYQRGGASLLDFLDAQKSYRDTQLNFVNLIGSYLAAASQLNLAVGREVIQ
ncbi:MAG TPA: TolC family protein [Edaphobacter sp.]|nr:TolC family protein [Edaphobacter sp.]